MTNDQNTVSTSLGGVVGLFALAVTAAQANANDFAALKRSAQAEAV